MGDGLDYNIYNLFRALSFVMATLIFFGSMSAIAGMDPLALAVISIERLGTMVGNTMSSMFSSMLGLI